MKTANLNLQSQPQAEMILSALTMAKRKSERSTFVPTIKYISQIYFSSSPFNVQSGRKWFTETANREINQNTEVRVLCEEPSMPPFTGRLLRGNALQSSRHRATGPASRKQRRGGVEGAYSATRSCFS